MAGLVERNQVGKREDLADIISIVDAKKTPFTSMVKKGSAPKIGKATQTPVVSKKVC